MSMMPLSAALLVSARTLQEQAIACIQNLPVRIALESTELGNTDELIDRIDRHRVDVVLLEAGRLAIPLDEFVRRLRETASQPALFVLHAEAAPQLILEALRAGASEFLHTPLNEPLREAFERLSAVRQKSSIDAPGGLGRIFGFLSAKGGCGATTFVSHIAPAVAKLLAAPTLLADFDFDAGMLRFVMKCRSSWSVRDALDNMHRMDANYWQKLPTLYGRHLDVLPAPDELAARVPGSARETEHLMRFLRSTYRAMLIDFGRHFSASACDAFPELDTLYLVTSADAADIEHARGCVDFMARRGYPTARVKVLLNRVAERGGPDRKSLEAALGLPFAAVFPTDHEALYDAWSEGRLLGNDSKLGRELQRLSVSLAARVRGDAVPPESVPAPSPARVNRLLSFFTKTNSVLEPTGAHK